MREIKLGRATCVQHCSYIEILVWDDPKPLEDIGEMPKTDSRMEWLAVWFLTMKSSLYLRE